MLPRPCQCGIEVGRYHYKACWLWQEGMPYQDGVPMEVTARPMTNKDRLLLKELKDLKELHVNPVLLAEAAPDPPAPPPHRRLDAAALKVWLKCLVASMSRLPVGAAIMDADAAVVAWQARQEPRDVTEIACP